jgi:hypothetical protein
MSTVSGVGGKRGVGGVMPEETVDANAVGSASPDLLPGAVQLLGSGDPGAELAALVSMSARSQKRLASELRKSEEAMMKKAEDDQVTALHRQAGLALAAGLLSGATTVAAAGFELASGLAGVRSKELHEAGDTAGSYTLERRATSFKMASTVFDAMGKVDEGVMNAASKNAEADGTRAQYAAGHAKRGVDDANELRDDAQRMLEKAFDFYREWTQGQAGAAQAALRRA